MRCCVVFGATLRLLVINISSSSPAFNTSAYYQRCVIITCEMVAVVLQRPCWQHLACYSINTALKPDIDSKSRFLPTPPAFDAPVRAVPVRVLLCCLAWKNKNDGSTRRWKYFNDMFVSFDTIHEREGHTDTAWWHRLRLCIASHGKNVAILHRLMATSWKRMVAMQH